MDRILKNHKITIICIGILLIIFLSVGIPTLSRYKNRTLNITEVWNGNVATKYKSGIGLQNDPYIISTGAELAYFSAELANTNYENTYFILNNDIILNEGIFKYEDNKVKYILNEITYYIKPDTNKYYDDELYTNEIGEINLFPQLNNFKGNLNGNSHTLYGLYIYDSNDAALFNNLEGNLNDLYVQNSLIYGANITSGIATTTNNAILKNILFDGYVISKITGINKISNNLINNETIQVQTTETTSYINLTNDLKKSGIEIISTSLTGNYDGLGTTLKINNIPLEIGEFNVDLGTTILDRIEISSIANETTDINLSNLSYNITYKYTITSGIIGISNNTILDNVINKANICGYSISSGLVGVTNNLLEINQSYNTGLVNSTNIASGIIGVIEKSTDNISITKTYNTGSITANVNGGLIGEVSNNIGTININNVFNTKGYSIGNKFNSTLNVANGYYTDDTIVNNSINASFVLTPLTNLYDKEYMLTNLAFNEFNNYEDLDNNDNKVWLYEDEALPILYIDDSNNPKVNLQLNVYSWNNYSNTLNPIKLNSNITFRIENVDETSSLEKLYYIHNIKDAVSQEPLSKSELDLITTWTPYENIVTLNQEGIYIIYVKTIDNEKISYVNSDLIILDLEGADITIKMDDKIWNTNNISNTYIDGPKQVTIEAIDNISGIKSIEYYMSNEIVDINTITWTSYLNPIDINEIGEYIIYAKVVDNSNYITYVNSDMIIYDGYVINVIKIGNNNVDYQNSMNITNNSTIKFNTTYTKEMADFNYNYTHNLVSNILLPLNTTITLIDNKNSKIYKYEITSTEDIYNYNNSCQVDNCIKKATYPFTLFKEIGKSEDEHFIENSYYNNGLIDEDFTIIIDFKNTENYTNVSLYLELQNNNEIIRPTLYNNLKYFNIYKNINEVSTEAILNLTSDYIGTPIVYNSDSNVSFNLTSNLIYKYLNAQKIIDTTKENKEMGLAIKLVDSNNNIINKEYLKNMSFIIDDKSYSPDVDNIIHIDLNNKVNDITKILTINTRESNSTLPKGNYYLKISNYLSNDGYYYDTLSNNEITIPVNVIDDNYNNIIYGFNVIMDDSDRILTKIPNEKQISFNILQNGSLYNPNVRISLYKKDNLTAISQSYSIVDLQTYTNDILNKYIDNVYYVTTSPLQYDNINKIYNSFVLNLNMNIFENTGYKFVFDLYDGTKKIGRIEKNFIVK